MNVPNCVIWTPTDGGYEVKRFFRSRSAAMSAVGALEIINEAAFEPVVKPAIPQGVVPHEARFAIAEMIGRAEADDPDAHDGRMVCEPAVNTGD